jgi:hypothetical protein
MRAEERAALSDIRNLYVYSSSGQQKVPFHRGDARGGQTPRGGAARRGHVRLRPVLITVAATSSRSSPRRARRAAVGAAPRAGARPDWRGGDRRGSGCVNSTEEPGVVVGAAPGPPIMVGTAARIGRHMATTQDKCDETAARSRLATREISSRTSRNSNSARRRLTSWCDEALTRSSAVCRSARGLSLNRSVSRSSRPAPLRTFASSSAMRPSIRLIDSMWPTSDSASAQAASVPSWVSSLNAGNVHPHPSHALAYKHDLCVQSGSSWPPAPTVRWFACHTLVSASGWFCGLC